MDFGNIPDDVLDYPYLRDLDEDFITIRKYLEHYDEDIIHAEWQITDVRGMNRLDNFIAWSEDSVFYLGMGLFCEQYIGKLPRNPSK